MVDKKITQSVEDLGTVNKTLWLDLPLARAKWGLGIGSERETLAAAWKGYDASMRLATAALDNLYRTPLFGELMARSLDSALRWQRLSNALAGVFFTGLRQVVGLPTAAETQALRAEVQALREELRSFTTGSAIRSGERTVVTEPAARLAAFQVKRKGTGAVNPTQAAA